MCEAVSTTTGMSCSFSSAFILIQHLSAFYFWQLQIEKDQIWRQYAAKPAVLEQELEGLLAIADHS